MSEFSELITQLMEITGLDAKTAEFILIQNHNNLEQAINFHLEGGSTTTTSSSFTNNIGTAAGPASSILIPEAAGLDMPILCDDDSSITSARPATRSSNNNNNNSSRRRPFNNNNYSLTNSNTTTNNNNNNNNNISNKRNGTDNNNKVILSEHAALPKSVQSDQQQQHQLLDEDGVRAPIPAKREQLLLPEEDQFSYSYAQTAARRHRRPNITTIPFRNFAREAEMQEAEMLTAAAAAAATNRTAAATAAALTSPLLLNPVSATADRQHQHHHQHHQLKYSLMRPPGIPAAKRPKRLEDIFRPPVDILFFGGMQAAREHSTNMNRWLLINLQDSYEFKSQVLNRDVWSDKSVRDIITANFILYQLMVDNPDGARFKVFYKINEIPYVGIIDPRTGEEQLQINVTTPQKLCDALRIFLTDNGLRLDPTKVHNNLATASSTITSSEPGSSKSSSSSSSMQNGHLENPGSTQELSKIKKTLELSEEEQLLLAIKNSLEDQPDCGSVEYRGYNSASDEESPVEEDPDQGGAGAGAAAAAAASSRRTDDAAATVAGATAKSKNNYKDYLGSDKDPLTKIQLRLPDGERVQLEWPSTSKLYAIKLFVLENFTKFEMKLIKLITTYPRQNIFELNQELTLHEAKLHPTSILYLHLDE